MIICCGEALVDMLPSGDRADASGDPGETHRGVLGGSIFNTARVAARLGLPTSYVSPVSTDQFGDEIVASLQKSNVDLQFVRRVDRPTALAWVTLKDGQAEYRFEDEGSATRMTTQSELPTQLPDCELAHFGSISLVTEPSASAFEAFALKLSSQTTISLDPNIRTAFIEDAPAHRTRLERLIAHADIVKLSDEDLDWFGVDADTAASKWLAGRTSVVAVTFGAKGVRGYCSEGQVDVPANPVDVVDTVGAGDSFSAGFYAGLNHSSGLDRSALTSLSLDDLESALSYGVHVSGQVVQQAGAELPW